MSIDTRYLKDKKYTIKYFSRKNVCRLCWKISKSAITIENDLPLAQFISENIGINVKGHILQTVCNLCADKLYRFINFKKFCLEADQKLTKILNGAGPLKKKIKVEHTTTDSPATKVKDNKIKSEPTESQEKDSNIKSESECTDNEPEPEKLSSPLPVSDEEKNQEPKSIVKPKRKYRCQICREIFNTSSAYRQHRNKNHPDHINKFVCETCGHALRSKQALANHVLIHTDQKIKCPQCDQCFKVPDHLKTHIRRVHKGERRFACHICPLRCFNNHILQIHLKTHFGIKSFQCHMCPNKYTLKKGLQKHIRLFHEGLVGQYECTYCSSKYNAMETLRRHMLKIHGKKIKACKGSFTVIEQSNNERGESSKIQNSKERMVKPNRGRDMIVGNELQESEQLFPSVLQQL